MTGDLIAYRPKKKNKWLLAELLKLAEKDNRSLNNYIEMIFLDWVQKNKIKAKIENEE